MAGTPGSIGNNFYAYGLYNSLQSVFPKPIVANRAPTTADIKYQIGRVWVYPATNAAYILTSVVSNSATWQLLEASGGAGVFTTLTSSGATTLATTGASTNTFGNTTGATSVGISVGTGGFTVTGVAGSGVTIGTGITTGAMLIGGALTTGTLTLGDVAMTGTLTLGNSTAGQTISVGDGVNTVAQTVSIAGGAAGAASTVSILGGNATAGTQTVNIATGTGGKIVNIANSAGTNGVSIGSTTGTSTLVLQAGSSGINMQNAPFVSLPGPVYIYTGAGAPAGGLALHTGDLYINTTGSTTATRLYIATGVGAWTYIPSNA